MDGYLSSWLLGWLAELRRRKRWRKFWLCPLLKWVPRRSRVRPSIELTCIFRMTCSTSMEIFSISEGPSTHLPPPSTFVCRERLITLRNPVEKDGDSQDEPRQRSALTRTRKALETHVICKPDAAQLRSLSMSTLSKFARFSRTIRYVSARGLATSGPGLRFACQKAPQNSGGRKPARFGSCWCR